MLLLGGESVAGGFEQHLYPENNFLFVDIIKGNTQRPVKEIIGGLFNSPLEGIQSWSTPHRFTVRVYLNICFTCCHCGNHGHSLHLHSQPTQGPLHTHPADSAGG